MSSFGFTARSHGLGLLFPGREFFASISPRQRKLLKQIAEGLELQKVRLQLSLERLAGMICQEQNDYSDPRMSAHACAA